MGNMRKRAELVTVMKEASEKILKIDAELESLKAFEPPERIAIVLHDLLCRHNHTDGCSWFYELKNGVHKWGGNEHNRWLAKGIRIHDFMINNDLAEEHVFEIVYDATRLD